MKIIRFIFLYYIYIKLHIKNQLVNILKIIFYKNYNLLAKDFFLYNFYLIKLILYNAMNFHF